MDIKKFIIISIHKYLNESIDKKIKDNHTSNNLDEDLWHGSPNDFNEFKLDYMGSGEGAQAFGWGLYFTELEDIADRYSRIKNDILSITQHLYGLKYTNKDVEELESMRNDEIIKLINNKFEEESLILKNKIKDKPDKTKFYNHLLNTKISLRDKYINELKKSNPTKYFAKFKDNKSIDSFNWLQWDKPLTDNQKTLIKKSANDETINDYIDKNGQNLYAGLISSTGSPKEASLSLLRSGFDGIKFPAESIARGKTSETARGFNYVIFNPDIINIEKKIKY